MKYIIFLGVIFVSLHAKGQTGEKDLYFAEVGWKIQMSAGATSLDHKQWDSLVQVTNRKIMPSDSLSINLRAIKVLFVFLAKEYNSFSGAISAFDSAKFPSWIDYHNFAKQNLMAIIAGMRPGIKIVDTASSVEVIDELPFQLFRLKTYYPDKGLTLQTYWYSCLRRGVDFAVNVAFSDETVGNQYLDVFRHSTFARN